jgi:hypothetical protein
MSGAKLLGAGSSFDVVIVSGRAVVGGPLRYSNMMVRTHINRCLNSIGWG